MRLSLRWIFCCHRLPLINYFGFFDAAGALAEDSFVVVVFVEVQRAIQLLRLHCRLFRKTWPTNRFILDLFHRRPLVLHSDLLIGHDLVAQVDPARQLLVGEKLA